jgi:hypothetical protein
MSNNKIPQFTIVNKSQKGGYEYSELLIPALLQDICKRITGCSKYNVRYVEDGYNKGRLAILDYNNVRTYVSLSFTGQIVSRNSFFQSLTTALVQYYMDTRNESNKRICFYFLPLIGNVETDYYKFMYRLMATTGVEFLNPEMFLTQTIQPFTSVDDVITARDKNKNTNKSNNSTYLTKGHLGTPQIYCKTYGANKKEAALLCMALSHISRCMQLFEIGEQGLRELPKPDMDVIKRLGRVEIIPTDITLERNEFEYNNSLRSPKYIYNLLEKLGPKKCALCGCEIPEIIEGAHIWPVIAIKNTKTINYDEQLQYATDGDNGIWLCSNHHGLLDKNYIHFNATGKVKYAPTMSSEAQIFIDDITSVTELSPTILTPAFLDYLDKRNKLAA